MMKRTILILLFLFGTRASFAQSRKDPRVRTITRAQLQQLIAKTPLNSRTHGRIIGWAQTSHLTGAAYAQYDNLWRKQPDDAYANLWRGITALIYENVSAYPSSKVRLSAEQKMRLWENGRSSLRDAVRLKPNLSWTNAAYGGFLFNQPRGEQEGMRLMRKAVKLEPKNASAWAALGDALINPYRSTHNPKEGEQALRNAARLDPLYASPHLALIRLYVGQKRFKEAQRELQAFKSLVPVKDAAQVTAYWKPDIDKGIKNQIKR